MVHIVSRLIAIHRPDQIPKPFVDAPQIEVRIEVTLVTLGFERAFEPRDRATKIALLNQVSADVVVGITKLRVYLNGLVALCDSFIKPPLITHRPATKSVSFGRRPNFDRLRV